MTTNFAGLLWPALVHGAGMALHTFLTVFASNPWPFLAAGAIALVGSLIPRSSRR